MCVYFRRDIQCSLMNAFTLTSNTYNVLTLEHNRCIFSVLYRYSDASVSVVFFNFWNARSHLVATEDTCFYFVVISVLL